MKKHLLFFFFISLSFVALAQTQQGYVKTKGRMENGKLVPGQGLKGTMISVQGRSAVLVNKDNGSFSFPVTSDQFRLDSVKKKGYQLVDLEACPRTYKYSSNPLYIVMETPDQQLQDQLTAERKIRRNLQKQLQDKEDEIENLKAQQKISVEEYHTALQKLYQEQENNEQLIKDMAKRYSELDYDQLDEFYRQVSYCIENGELVKADSLLKTRGDITAQVADIKQRGQALQDERSQLEKAETVQQADIEEAARRCYSYFETFKAQHLNDTAAYFIELRASLDTTNVDWQLDAGSFILDYIADYDKALGYFYLGLRHSQQQYGEKNGKTAAFYNNIGVVYCWMEDYGKAMEYQNNALAIWESLFGMNSSDVATAYNNIGNLHIRQSNFEMASECLNTALNIRETIFEESHPDLAISYQNIGYLHVVLGDYNKALEFYGKALSINETVYGKDYPGLANTYNNIGVALYHQKGVCDTVLECLKNALSIQAASYGENHPDVATSYNNLGYMYAEKGDYKTALEYFNKSLDIRKQVFGENHTVVAGCYNNIGMVYSHQGDQDKAIEYYNMDLSICKSALGENNSEVAVSYNSIGLAYYRKGDFPKALEFYKKALSIRVSAFGENHPDVAWSYNNIGSVYRGMKEYGTALEYYQKALIIWEETLGLDHQNTQMVKDKISEVKAKMKESEK